MYAHSPDSHEGELVARVDILHHVPGLNSVFHYLRLVASLNTVFHSCTVFLF
jgi:hypothetical protein